LRRELEEAEGGSEEGTAAVGRDGILFDHPIRPRQRRRRDRKAERLGGVSRSSGMMVLIIPSSGPV
jgi:hypothetical protein